MKKLAGIFRDLEHLYDFQRISYDGHFVFQNVAKILQTSFHSPYSFCANLMKLAGIFQDLEHLYDFQTFSYGSHFVFQNEAKILQRQVFIAINIPCKFGEDIFINE